jgi:ubiquilin
MGPPPSQEQMIEMLSNPAFSQMMNEALQNPAMIDMMIQQNPQLREMGPAGRQFLQSDQFRRMVTDPQSLRAMGQLQAAMGMGPFGGAGGGGQEAFPAPGETTTTAAENREAGTGGSQDHNQNNATTSPAGTNTGAAGPNPFAALFGMPPNQANPDATNPSASQPQNPFAALFGTPAPTSNQQQETGAQGTNPSNPFLNIQNNPLFQHPDLMNQFVQAMGGGGAGGAGAGNMFGGNAGGANPFANLGNLMGGGGMGSPAVAPDNRPPEERYATQLRQLNEMGFFDFNRNIQALQRSGGDVNGALEWLFSQP